ncbi:kyphoscoliosis peptidase-like [Ptychodera flava]|uniref:kyphoscoliosis peptidase-like n=1 Tax=Ptychodera flava TaxID=63121 RepID=UPI003969FAC8
MGCGSSKSTQVENQPEAKTEDVERAYDNEALHGSTQSIDDSVDDESDSEPIEESPTHDVKQPSQKYFNIEDTFWKEKRKLIPNYDRMRVLDQHALKAPKRLKNSPKDLVSYLLKPAKNDLERYRLLFRWEAQNVDYDVEGYYSGNYGDNSPEGVLKNGKSVCEGYGGLYKYLCELAGLECVKLSGSSKGGDYKPGDVFPIIDGKVKTDHAWNKIKIDGDWYLCDCTWAAGTVGFDKDCGENKYKRCWNEYYFLSDPEMFTSEHFPIDENGNVSAVDQLLQKPFLDLNKWSDVAKQTAHTMRSGEKQYIGFPAGMGGRCWGANLDFTTAGFQVHGHRVPIISTNTGKVTITVRLPKRMTPLLCEVHLQTENGLEQLQGLFCGERKGRKGRLNIWLPYKGEYRFTIMAKLKKNSESFWTGANYLICNTYPLTVEEKFPDYDGLWGPNEHFFKLGLHVTSLAVITAENGDHCLTVRKGSDIDLTCNIERNGTKMPTCIFADSNFNGEEVNFRIRLPEAGFYKFTLHAKKKNQDGSYPKAGQWLIDCKSAWAGELYPDDSGLWGPSDTFFDLGMKAANLSTSLVIAEGGQCSLSFSMPDKTVVTGSLERNGVKQDTSLFSEVAIDGTSVTYHMRLRDEGFYVFTLFAKKRGKGGTFPFAGKWLIESKSKWNGQLYPVGDWGPSDDFHRLGLSMERGKSSFIIVSDGKCDVTIMAPKPISTTYYLYKGDERLSETEKTECIEVNTDDTSITYRLTLPGFGFYKFELFGNVKSQMNLPFLGRWLIDRQ